MNDDLSDESCAQWMRQVNMPKYAVNALVTWQECRRRAEANRWASFSDEEIEDLVMAKVTPEIWAELEAELSRRAKEGKHSDKGTEARDAHSER